MKRKVQEFLRDLDTHQEIQEKAYFLWKEAGCPEGSGVEFWLKAEKQIKIKKAAKVVLAEKVVQ